MANDSQKRSDPSVETIVRKVVKTELKPVETRPEGKKDQADRQIRLTKQQFDKRIDDIFRINTDKILAGLDKIMTELRAIRNVSKL